MRYRIPKATLDAPHTAEIERQKSRFIGWCAHAPDAATAEALVAAARTRYPDASHHCLAYIAGPPGEQQAIGFSDDGEPGGTAGRPMFQALAGAEIGEIACVATRYFGGTQLGTGGLARAYAQTVSAVLAELPVVLHVPRRAVRLHLAFADEQPARAWLAEHDAHVIDTAYHAQGVTLTVGWPTDATTSFKSLDARLGGRLGEPDPPDDGG